MSALPDGKCAMNQRNRFQNDVIYRWGALGACAVILMIAHAFVRPDFGDDLTYAGIWGQQPLIDLLRERYNEWSSRVIIEAVMMPLTAASPWIWRILDVLMILLLIWITADLFGTERKLQAQVMFFAMMWSVPLFSLSSAGWITTTVNYLWALTLGLVAMRPLKHWSEGVGCSLWEYIICPVCALYASNMEQMGAILLGVYLVSGLYLLTEKRRLSPFYYVQLALIGLSLFFILSAPGNSARTLSETERFFPEFAALNVYEKVWMGFLETAHYYLAAGHEQSSWTFGLFAGTLFFTASAAKCGAAIRQRRKKAVLVCVAACPVAFYWGIGHLGNYLLNSGILTRGRNGVGVLAQNRQLPGLSYFSAQLIVFQTAVYLFVIACVVMTIVLLYGKSRETILELVILGAGFLSRIIVGFSPTLYASGDRTAIFCSAAVLIVTLRSLQFFRQCEDRALPRLAAAAYTAICIVGNLL